MIAGRHAADFTPPLGLANRHLQTLLPRVLPQPKPCLLAERFELPDGDFVELAWLDTPTLPVDAPLLVLFHGLEGSVNSPYARHLLNAARQNGWRAVLMHFRGCGVDTNRLPRAYHSGDTADAHWLLECLGQRYPAAPRVALGVSLGANMLLKLVAEDTDNRLGLNGAIAVAPPVDLAGCAESLELGIARLYQRHLLNALIRKVSPRLARRELPLQLTSHELAHCTSLRAYDDAVTAPLHGFKDAADYYRRAAAGPVLAEIGLPTLIVHADDDPFMPPGLYDDLRLGPGVRLEIARHGGHVGFVEYRHGRLTSWLAYRLRQQLDAWVPRHRQ